MKKVKVIKIDNYIYTLEDANKKIYKKNFEFYDTEISVGDYIYISEEVLKEVNLFAYGPIIENNEVEDLIKIIHNDKNIYLQRYYG